MFDRNKILQLIGVDVWRLRVQKKPPLNDKSKDSWVTLQNEVKSCELCSLHKTRTQTVFGVGDSKADWLFIGEAPGKDEDLQGEPFVGRAGGLLNEMVFFYWVEQRKNIYCQYIEMQTPTKSRPIGF